MKKSLILLIVLCGLFVTSCKQQYATPSETALDAIFNSMQASAARTAAANDPVTQQMCKGKLTSIDISALSSSITAYVKANYAGATIKFAGKDDKGQTVVGISLNGIDTGLLFDANGVFVKKLEKFGERSKLTEVAITALPASISSYVSSKYAGFTIKRAGKDADGNFIVGLDNGTNHKVLKFNASGVFIEEMQIPPHGGPQDGAHGGPGGNGH